MGEEREKIRKKEREAGVEGKRSQRMKRRGREEEEELHVFLCSLLKVTVARSSPGGLRGADIRAAPEKSADLWSF